MLCFHFFFLPPFHTFTIADPQNWVALTAFFITALVVGQLSANAKRRAEEAEAGRIEIRRLYDDLQGAFERASEVEALEKSERLKSALLDAVTHDVRTPLTSIAGRSSVMTPERQAKLLGDAWERLEDKPHQPVLFQVIGPDDEIYDFYLGAHAPDLSDEEVQFIHQLWLDVSHERGLENVRHKEIVSVAMIRLADELHGNRRRQVLDFLRTLKKGNGRN